MNNGEVFLRLLLSVTIGGFIGYERGLNNRAAGFRTHILVCTGAAITSMIELYSLESLKQIIAVNPALTGRINADMLRLGAQVISGVGFLGVGTIIHERGSVKGLTTAASLWVVACIGIAVGFGFYTLSLMSFAFVFFALVLLKSFEHRFIDKTRKVKLEIVFDEKKIPMLNRYFKDNGIRVRNIEYALEEDEADNHCIYTIIIPLKYDIDTIVEELCHADYIISVKLVP